MMPEILQFHITPTPAPKSKIGVQVQKQPKPKETSPMTEAERIAEIFNNDGSCFELPDDTNLYVTCESVAIDQEESGGGVCRYLFRDRSAIVVGEDGWAIEGSVPFNWQGVIGMVRIPPKF